MRILCTAIILSVSVLCAFDVRAQVPRAASGWTDTSPHQVLSIDVAPDVRLEVLDWGGAGDVLVFLAGMSMNAHVFDYFAPRFTDQFRVVGITRRGHGASTWPSTGYSLPTLVHDIYTALDSLAVENAIVVGHSFAGLEMTLLATEYPDRIKGLIYIDAVQDLTALPEVIPTCPAGRRFEEAAERLFQNVEAFRRTQRRVATDGNAQPNASAAAMTQIMAALEPPDYTEVRTPALAIAYVPERIDDIFLGTDTLSDSCRVAAQRLVFGGIAAFAEGIQQGTVVTLQETQHNIHLVSPDELELAMRRWLGESLQRR